MRSPLPICLLVVLAACSKDETCPSAPSAASSADPTKVAILERDCKRGDPNACATLGAMYRLGDGTPRDLDKADDYDKKAMMARVARCFHGDEAACEKLPRDHRLAPPSIDLANRATAEAIRTIVSVTIDRAGHVAVDGKAVADPLGPAFAGRCKASSKVVISADRRTLQSRVIAVLDAAKSAGCTRIALAAPKP